VTDAGEPATAAALFARAAETCAAAVAEYVDVHSPDVRFQRYVLLALAALEELAERPVLEAADLRLLRDAASEAAGVCRTAPPTDGLVAIASCLDDVAGTCDRLLGDAPSEDAPPARWRRFCFADADFHVLRSHEGWHVRRSAAEARGRLFDRALEELEPTLSNFRIAAITVQVLDWHAHLDEHGAAPA
jgi:hypothetical protein